MQTLKKLIRRIYLRFAKPTAHPARMSDRELYAALAIDSEHPVYAAMLEIATRARHDARDQARSCIDNHAECSYYLGAEWALEAFAEYAAAARAEAEQRASAPDRE